MNSLINTLFNDIAAPRTSSSIKESGDVFISELELPGFAKKDIKLQITDDILTVSAKNKEREKQFKLFLNNLVSEDHISAELKNGLLKITLPKKTVSEGREVEIK